MKEYPAICSHRDIKICQRAFQQMTGNKHFASSSRTSESNSLVRKSIESIYRGATEVLQEMFDRKSHSQGSVMSDSLSEHSESDSITTISVSSSSTYSSKSVESPIPASLAAVSTVSSSLGSEDDSEQTYSRGDDLISELVVYTANIITAICESHQQNSQSPTCLQFLLSLSLHWSVAVVLYHSRSASTISVLIWFADIQRLLSVPQLIASSFSLPTLSPYEVKLDNESKDGYKDVAHSFPSFYKTPLALAVSLALSMGSRSNHNSSASSKLSISSSSSSLLSSSSSSSLSHKKSSLVSSIDFSLCEKLLQVIIKAMPAALSICDDRGYTPSALVKAARNSSSLLLSSSSISEKEESLYKLLEKSLILKYDPSPMYMHAASSSSSSSTRRSGEDMDIGLDHASSILGKMPYNQLPDKSIYMLYKKRPRNSVEKC